MKVTIIVRVQVEDVKTTATKTFEEVDVEDTEAVKSLSREVFAFSAGSLYREAVEKLAEYAK